MAACMVACMVRSTKSVSPLMEDSISVCIVLDISSEKAAMDTIIALLNVVCLGPVVVTVCVFVVTDLEL